MHPTDVSSPSCIATAAAILGDKWTPLIVRALTNCPASFSELETSLENISPRTLSQRLDKLEAQQIIAKNLYCERPPRYRYELTQKGRDLEAILSSMAVWGEKYA